MDSFVPDQGCPTIQSVEPCHLAPTTAPGSDQTYTRHSHGARQSKGWIQSMESLPFTFPQHAHVATGTQLVQWGIHSAMLHKAPNSRHSGTQATRNAYRQCVQHRSQSCQGSHHVQCSWCSSQPVQYTALVLAPPGSAVQIPDQLEYPSDHASWEEGGGDPWSPMWSTDWPHITCPAHRARWVWSPCSRQISISLSKSLEQDLKASCPLWPLNIQQHLW